MSQSPSSAGALGTGGILNNKGGAVTSETSAPTTESVATAAEHQQPVAQMHAPAQFAPDRENSPHESEHSKFSGPMNTSYPSPTAMNAALPNAPAQSMSAVPMGLPGLPLAMIAQSNQAFKPPVATEPHQPPQKSYPCSTCGKAFARRSDLARHERIHSGVRPHVCDFTGCGKQFIQRSALTVHMRVHTGEKPHQCERCGKPFSDSSSLARHRRIHLGTRPYKCPYADCQKTFTRRTTLTRHQNHHTGTIDDAARATAEALARNATARTKVKSEGEQASTQESPITTPSPVQESMSMSPSTQLAELSNLQYASNSSLPGHLRGDAQANPGSPSSATTAFNGNGAPPTSHPTGYGPPQPLEPSAEQQTGPGSAGASPHLGSVGWQSPSNVESPTNSNSGNGYVYPDPEGYPSNAVTMGQMFYNSAAAVKRSGSTEPAPASYDSKARQGELWAGAQ